MSQKISILAKLFACCDTPESISARIKFLQPEYDELTSNFNEHATNDFANRIFGLAKSNNRLKIQAGARLTGADETYKGEPHDLFFLRSLCVRLGYIDGMNPAHDTQYCF